MSNYVLVLDTNRQPLAPCHPARARELLTKGKAAVFRRYPFTIILGHVPPGSINDNFELRLDPGSKTTGIAVISKGQRGNRCVLGINLHHRGEAIKKALFDRASYRRSRRARKTRYRQIRFLNRTRPKGWLTPSVLHRVLTTQTWIDRLTRYCPITTAKEEEVKFDTQRLVNPDIMGKKYQNGPLFNTEMREYLLKLYNHTCQYCTGISGDKVLEREHKHPKSRGGSNSLSNTTLACKICNDRKGNLTPEEFLVWIGNKYGSYFDALRKNLPKVIAGKHPSMKDAAVMNATRYRLRNYLTSLGLQPTLHRGWYTKRNRLDQHYRKDHWIDAACVGEIGSRVYIPNHMRCLSVKATGHTRRRMVLPDRYGFPRGKSKGPSRVKGFKTGDIAKVSIPKGKHAGTHVGRVAVRKTGHFNLKKNIDINFKYFTKIHAKDGYEFRYGEPRNDVILKEDYLKLDCMTSDKYKVTSRQGAYFIISTHKSNKEVRPNKQCN